MTRWSGGQILARKGVQLLTDCDETLDEQLRKYNAKVSIYFLASQFSTYSNASLHVSKSRDPAVSRSGTNGVFARHETHPGYIGRQRHNWCCYIRFSNLFVLYHVLESQDMSEDANVCVRKWRKCKLRQDYRFKFSDEDREEYKPPYLFGFSSSWKTFQRTKTRSMEETYKINSKHETLEVLFLEGIVNSILT